VRLGVAGVPLFQLPTITRRANVFGRNSKKMKQTFKRLNPKHVGLQIFDGRVLAFFGLISIILALGGSVSSQLSLRKAMDYDGDGKADPAIFRMSNNNWYLVHSGSGGYSVQNFGVSASDFLTPGDYDGDGKGDVALWRDTDGTFYYIKSSDLTFNTRSFGQTDDEPVARDYDGDGKTDFAVVRRVDGVMRWYIQGSTVGFYSADFGIPSDFVAPGDYDGDGKFDRAIYRAAPNNGASSFYVSQSTAGYTVVSWGLGNDLVVPGDYDGDGKTDYAVVNSSGGYWVWRIIRSDGIGYIISGWGVSDGSDFPVQNDYDGDGKTDRAIWRTGTGVYWIARSLDGGTQNYNWGQDGDFPIAYYDVH